ncbi:MAG: hypothetical protein SRB2_03187 [Desulfobacteraceae bacterium Eth-SRB2]|nr:MAG: hypothetical protein SRB2_03187 [Desulfobacteraceae bacterium Eth-SRB2]
MNYFRYKLISPTGELLSGIVKLPYKDVMSAISHLERDGGITIYVKNGPGSLVSLFHSGCVKSSPDLPRQKY